MPSKVTWAPSALAASRADGIEPLPSGKRCSTKADISQRGAVFAWGLDTPNKSASKLRIVIHFEHPPVCC